MIGTDRSKWTIRDVALRQLESCGDRIFLQEVDGDNESYGNFIRRAIAFARFLRMLHVQRGSTVAIFCRNGLPGLHAWLAVSLIGAIEVPINQNYRADILRHILTVAKPSVIVADAELLSALSAAGEHLSFIRDIVVIPSSEKRISFDVGPSVRVHDYSEIIADLTPGLPDVYVGPADVASIMFTSGTTGPSKGVMIPNGQVCLLALQTIQSTRMNADDLFYCAHPMNHIAGKHMGVFATFVSGGRLILDRRFEASQWLERIQRYAVTLSIAHGPMIEMIYQTPPSADDRNHAMRRLMCCPMPKQIADKFESRFALRGIEMWGLTEVACPCWTPFDGPRVPNSCGRAMLEWYEVAIVDPETDECLEPGAIGEIVVRPRYPWTTMQGYLGMPEQTVEAWRNMWFHTGDAAYVDAAGNFFFIDRIKDRIRRRAENISSYDIEAAAQQYPGIREVAAIGVPSEYEDDDEIKLYIVPQPAAEISPLALLRFLAGRLPHTMVPRYIEFLDALPRTPTNKVRKRELRDSKISTKTWDRHAAGVKLRELMEEASASG
jgi:crotonobetaine/carnitine-CoA ligase